MTLRVGLQQAILTAFPQNVIRQLSRETAREENIQEESVLVCLKSESLYMCAVDAPLLCGI